MDVLPHVTLLHSIIQYENLSPNPNLNPPTPLPPHSSTPIPNPNPTQHRHPHSPPPLGTLREVSWIICNNHMVNTLRPRQNGRHFLDDIFKCIFLNETVWISIQISLRFVTKVPINNIPALVQIMAWRRPGDKPLSEAMMVSLLTHICVTRPQWVSGGLVNSPLKFEHGWISYTR